MSVAKSVKIKKSEKSLSEVITDLNYVEKRFRNRKLDEEAALLKTVTKIIQMGQSEQASHALFSLSQSIDNAAKAARQLREF